MMLKNRWKKAACLILTIISTVCLGKVDVKAADYWPDAPETLSPSVILMEESTGTILYEKNMDEAHYPASITKIMTTLLALENGNLSDMVTFSDDAINNTEGSGIARDYGEQMTLEQCLYGVMLESANECAYAVAEHVGGTVENFVDMMNAKAKELGCTNTHFATPNGLDAGLKHYTTARDMAKIASYAWQYSRIREIVGTRTKTIKNLKGKTYNLVSTNRLLHEGMAGIGGMKTGYTDKAGQCFVGVIKGLNGKTYISVTFGARTTDGRWADARKLLSYARNLK